MFRAKPEDGIVWITGASAGIGHAVALRLAGQGFRVAATARRGEVLAGLETESGGRVTPYPGDVTDAARMAEVVATIERKAPIALAILNAGVYHISDERQAFDAAKVWQTIETNLGGTIRCLDPVLKAMTSRGRGQIAIVASLAGYGGIPGSIAYGSAKSAMITMAEALRLTYAAQGLTIQVINPGFVETAMTARNPYPMPFMMSAERAGRIVCDGLARGGFEISFPRRLVWPMKAAMLLPYAVWLPLMARATRRTKHSTDRGID